jgi:hypothetical protein
MAAGERYLATQVMTGGNGNTFDGSVRKQSLAQRSRGEVTRAYSRCRSRQGCNG